MSTFSDAIEYSPVDSNAFVRFLLVEMPIVGLRLMRISLANSDIRVPHLALLSSGPFVQNDCLFSYNSSGALNIRVQHEFLAGTHNVMHIVFVTSVQQGINYECREPTDFIIENGRVLGYVVLFSRYDIGVWTKPFDLSRHHHMHNMLFDRDINAARNMLYKGKRLFESKAIHEYF